MDKNKEALMAFYRKALTANTETTPAEVLNPILADDFVSYGSVDSKGKEQLIGQLGFFWKLIPNLIWEPQDLLHDAEKGKYVVRSKATGTPNGDFMGLPTDGTKSFDIMTIDIHKIVDGKIVEVHHLEDWATAMKQLKG
ncbi:MAG: ester cyclase [Chitinophagales bacterium]|nr:ester cyclase [Chitinophagales bacterium]